MTTNTLHPSNPRTRSVRFAALGLLALASLLASAGCQSVAPPDDPATSTSANLEPWSGRTGPTLPVAETLHGRLVVGYQGWFSTEGDGSVPGWVHYGTRNQPNSEPVPGEITIEYWPDMSELSEAERFPTQFKHADGSTATLFSSAHPLTVDRHFQWMKEHELDSAFLQRFPSSFRRPHLREHRNRVLNNVRAAANRHQRAWALMYDLSGLRQGEIESILMEDFREMIDQRVVGGDPAYQRHNGKPVVVVWGIGFNDGRDYTLAECEALIEFLQNDPVYGGHTVMVGVPYHWRTSEQDALPDPALHRILAKADIISPWTVGRHRNLEDIAEWGRSKLPLDLEWCEEQGNEYMPVIFSGFSWHNLRKSQGIDRPFNQIPRLGGQFLWAHGKEVRRNNLTMAYVAMFDEVDEGTQIFKVTNDPPVGESPFLTYEGYPTDHYLWLAGRVRALLRGDIPLTEDLPARDP